MIWSPEMVAELRALAGAKTSAAAAAEHIGRRFGVALSCSAVLGKAHRLGIRFQAHKTPEFAARHAERAAERMRKLHADPEFAAKNAERMRKLHADPEFAAKHARKWAKKAVERAGLKPWKKLIDRAAALLREGHDIETAADALVQEFRRRRAPRRGELHP